MSSEPPEEPLSRSEYNILSPASPKPIHFPAPTNIPVLDMQTDVGFNQMEPHMSDPTTRNTETRPDMWQDPNEQHTEQAPEAAMGATPLSTGVAAPSKEDEEAGAAEHLHESGAASSGEIGDVPASAAQLQPTPVSNSASNDADHAVTTEDDSKPQPIDPSASQPGQHVPNISASAASHPDAFSAQTDEVKLDSDVSQPAPGAVDLEGLLSTLQAPPASNDEYVASHGMTISQPTEIHDATLAHPNAPVAPGVSAGSSPLSASNLGVPPSGLPPRPPPQEQPLINPNYAHSQHIRDYHPHAAHSAYQPHGHSGSQGNPADPSSRNFVPPVGSLSDSAQHPNGAGSQAAFSPTAGGASAQPVSYTASPASALSSFPPNQGTFGFQYQSGGAGQAVGNEASRHAGRRPEDRPWDAEVQRKYDRFLEEERRYVAEGRWEQFPQGSRLFVGNLSSEKVTKRDIFHVFHTYGQLAQISIKQAYGFVQFLRAEDCVQALEAEQSTQIRDKKIHLEVSKPQKNRPQPQQRRSRSPPDSRNRQGMNNDRYNNNARAGSNRRDDYRPSRRSPSPRGYRDRYDDRHRRRSPSPQGYGNRGRGYRNQSPRRDEGDDLPLPPRQPGDVPDVQIIALDPLDRDFINWVEQAFKARGVRVDALLLSPRLNEQAVVRRQIVEGVLAVVKLTRQNQNSGQIGLQIFDRSAGVGNVRFEEYDNLPPPTCAELVLREKSKGVQPPSRGGGAYYSQQPQQQQYGGYQPQQQQPSAYAPQPPTGFPPSYTPQPQPQAQGSVPPHLQSLITNLDPNNLQSLLSAMSGGAGTPQSAQQNPQMQALQQNPQLAGLLQAQQGGQGLGGGMRGQGQGMGGGQGSGSSNVNMQDILARLGNSGAR